MARLLALLMLFAAPPAMSQGWAEEKCRLYGQAWQEAIRQRGTQGLSAGFLAAHDRFLAGGCRDKAVCPRSEAEVAMADLMTIMALNARIAGTFLPFLCRS